MYQLFAIPLIIALCAIILGAVLHVVRLHKRIKELEKNSDG